MSHHPSHEEYWSLTLEEARRYRRAHAQSEGRLRELEANLPAGVWSGIPGIERIRMVLNLVQRAAAAEALLEVLPAAVVGRAVESVVRHMRLSTTAVRDAAGVRELPDLDMVGLWSQPLRAEIEDRCGASLDAARIVGMLWDVSPEGAAAMERGDYYSYEKEHLSLPVVERFAAMGPAQQEEALQSVRGWLEAVRREALGALSPTLEPLGLTAVVEAAIESSRTGALAELGSGMLHRVAEPVRVANRQKWLDRVAALDLAGCTGEGRVYDTRGRTFGAEIEVVIPDALGPDGREDILMALFARLGIPAEIGRRMDYKTWSIVTDSSIKSGIEDDRGYSPEIVSPVLEGLEGQREYRRVLEALARLGCVVNDSCGAHWHVGALDLANRPQAQNALLRNYAANEERLESYVAPSRSSSVRYGGAPLVAWRGKAGAAVGCKAIEGAGGAGLVAAWGAFSDRLGEADRAHGEGRDSDDQGADAPRLSAAANSLATSKHVRVRMVSLASSIGTVESRQLDGTLDAERSLGWLEGFVQMVDAASAHPEKVMLFTAPNGALGQVVLLSPEEFRMALAVRDSRLARQMREALDGCAGGRLADLAVGSAVSPAVGREAGRVARASR